MDLKLNCNTAPQVAFLGGCWYGGMALPFTLDHRARRHLGEGYGLFRIEDGAAGTVAMRSGYYLKAPVAVIQAGNKAVLWEMAFRPGQPRPFLGLRLTATEAELLITGGPFTVKTKPTAHFGAWRGTERCSASLDDVEVRRYEGDNWRDLLREYALRWLCQAPDPDRTAWIDAAALARSYLRRAYADHWGLHAEFMLVNRPANLGGRDLFTLTTYEMVRAEVLERWGESAKAKKIWNRLILNDAVSLVLPELGSLRLWHNTVIIKEGRLQGVTEYGSGLAGYPGGQAGLLLPAIKLYGRHPEWGGEERLRQGIAWLLHTQRADGGWDLVYPTVPRREGDEMRQATGGGISPGQTAAGARTLLAAHRQWHDARFLEQGLAALRAVNPRAPEYAFAGFGYLRDAGEREPDGVTAVELIHANLLAYELTDEAAWRDVAVVLGHYLISWQRGGCGESYAGVVDPMAASFSPRLAMWDTMLWAEAYLALYEVTRDAFWQALGWSTANAVLPYQDQISGGWSESWPLDRAGTAHPFYIENGITAWGLRLAMRLGIGPLELAPDTPRLPAPPPDLLPRAEVNVVLARSCRAGFGPLRKIIPRAVRRALKRHLPCRTTGETIPLLDELPAVPGIPARELAWQLERRIDANRMELTIIAAPGVDAVKRVFVALTFPSLGEKITVMRRLGKNVRTFTITAAGRPLEIDLPCTTGDRVWLSGGQVIIEVTCKAFWAEGARLEFVVVTGEKKRA